jgi:hypothetical protein
MFSAHGSHQAAQTPFAIEVVYAQAPGLERVHRAPRLEGRCSVRIGDIVRESEFFGQRSPIQLFAVHAGTRMLVGEGFEVEVPDVFARAAPHHPEMLSLPFIELRAVRVSPVEGEAVSHVRLELNAFAVHLAEPCDAFSMPMGALRMLTDLNLQFVVKPASSYVRAPVASSGQLSARLIVADRIAARDMIREEDEEVLRMTSHGQQAICVTRHLDYSPELPHSAFFATYGTLYRFSPGPKLVAWKWNDTDSGTPSYAADWTSYSTLSANVKFYSPHSSPRLCAYKTSLEQQPARKPLAFSYYRLVVRGITGAPVTPWLSPWFTIITGKSYYSRTGGSVRNVPIPFQPEDDICEEEPEYNITALAGTQALHNILSTSPQFFRMQPAQDTAPRRKGTRPGRPASTIPASEIQPARPAYEPPPEGSCPATIAMHQAIQSFMRSSEAAAGSAGSAPSASPGIPTQQVAPRRRPRRETLPIVDTTEQDRADLSRILAGVLAGRHVVGVRVCRTDISTGICLQFDTSSEPLPQAKRPRSHALDALAAQRNALAVFSNALAVLQGIVGQEQEVTADAHTQEDHQAQTFPDQPPAPAFQAPAPAFQPPAPAFQAPAPAFQPPAPAFQPPAPAFQPPAPAFQAPAPAVQAPALADQPPAPAFQPPAPAFQPPAPAFQPPAPAFQPPAPAFQPPAPAFQPPAPAFQPPAPAFQPPAPAFQPPAPAFQPPALAFTAQTSRYDPHAPLFSPDGQTAHQPVSSFLEDLFSERQPSNEVVTPGGTRFMSDDFMLSPDRANRRT